MKLRLIVPLLLLISACEKIVEDPVFSEVPAIVLLEVSQDTIVQFTEQLIVTIQYEDGDGDLGTSDPDINSIFVQDSRLEEADEYYLPPLAPEDATISITGSFDLKLSPTFLLGNGTQEISELSIYLIDRAGNKSNTLKAGPIIIKKE
ncbi:MAG: hypothetical protein KDC34_11520 [Saprospiraceae bacterium]|nr:hypothetical protein [Saprospiraceae bacterium]